MTLSNIILLVLIFCFLVRYQKKTIEASLNARWELVDITKSRGESLP